MEIDKCLELQGEEDKVKVEEELRSSTDPAPVTVLDLIQVGVRGEDRKDTTQDVGSSWSFTNNSLIVTPTPPTHPHLKRLMPAFRIIKGPTTDCTTAPDLKRLKISPRVPPADDGSSSGSQVTIPSMDRMWKATRTVPQEILAQKKTLPIYAIKKEFLKVFKDNQVVIVKGETGSGKSSQIPQYLLESGYGTCGKIACTQPRRIAAKSLATRVSEEMGVNLGELVGYKVRFDHKVSQTTSIVYLTDGTLLRELTTEPNIYFYSVVILDEAHERGLQTDVLLGLLKATLKQRPDLKIIVSSATLDCSKFSAYFNNAPIFEIPGRVYPVEIVYSHYPVDEYVKECAETVRRIHQLEGEGDILVFLGGQDEILQVCELLDEDQDSSLWVVPCYSSLPGEEQNRVFEPLPLGCTRKVVVATNIAETSVTIDGIVFVVDSGMVKVCDYQPIKKMKTLSLQNISQAQADQRSGRAGRTRAGKAIRLYTREWFEHLEKTGVPEIQRSNLDEAVLLLAAHGVTDVYTFDFIDPPSPESIRNSVVELKDLQALDISGNLTTRGHTISKFPLDPKLSKTLLTSVQLQCTDEILTIVSLLSAQSSSGNIFVRPKKQSKQQADSVKMRFFAPHGDHFILLNVFQQWQASGYSPEWCLYNGVNFNTIQESLFVRGQLEVILQENGLYFPAPAPHSDNFKFIQQALLSGYFSQVAHKNSRGHGYVTYSNPQESVFIHPSSVLFKTAPTWVLYEDVTNTGRKPFIRNLVAIEPHWIRHHSPTFYEKLKLVFPDFL